MDNNANQKQIEEYASKRFTYFWGDGTGEVSKELIKIYLIQYRKFPNKKPHILNMLQTMTNYFNGIKGVN